MGLFLALVFGASASARQSAQAPEPAPDLVDAPGKDVVLRLCGDCHEPATRIRKQRRSEDGWAELLTDMEGRGMEATQKEIDVVLTYLTAHYGCLDRQQSGPCKNVTATAATPDLRSREKG